MNNSNILMAVVALIYMGISVSLLREGSDLRHAGMALCYFGYVIGNIGLILANIGG